jgi:hypothetical protein
MIAISDVRSRMLIWLPNVSVDWASQNPARDKPVCGFSGTVGPCATGNGMSVVSFDFKIAFLGTDNFYEKHIYVSVHEAHSMPGIPFS